MGESYVVVASKNLSNERSPRLGAEQFSRGTMKRDHFLAGIHVKGLALMPFRRDHWKLHGQDLVVNAGRFGGRWIVTRPAAQRSGGISPG